MNAQNKRPVIRPGCIGCGYCQFVCPDVFYVDEVSQVKELVSYSEHKEAIERAARECPMHVIVTTIEETE